MASNAEEPPVKKAKVDEEAKDEKPAEQEKDAPADTRQKLDGKVTFLPADTTLNVVPTMGGKVLMALTDGGMQYLMAGARASVGVKKGRYLFEVRVVEALWLHENYQGQRGQPPKPKQIARIGFSVAGSSLVLGDGDGGVGFDSDGSFLKGGMRAPGGSKFARDQVVGILLNLDPKSPNANTISLFREGQRVSQPMAIPEALHGKTLFPHVSYRCMSVQVHFGPTPLKALPFTCRMLQDAAKADLEVKKAPGKEKCTVVFPVALPDEGGFDWADSFLEKNSGYVELSDRSIQDWAVQSGFWRPSKKGGGWGSSNDKPEFNFGVSGMDDGSAPRAARSVAPLVPRNYVMMELKQNLVAEERKANLRKFSSSHYKRVARVVMGKPSAEFVAGVQKFLLQDKQARLDAEYQVRKMERERKKAAAEKKKALEEKKRELEEKKKKDAEAKKEAGEEGEEKKEEEEAKEEVKEEEVKEEKKEEEEEEVEEAPPVAELTEEEKAMTFKPSTVSDLAGNVLAAALGGISMPDKSEGFDEIVFEWSGAKEAQEHLTTFLRKHKLTARVDDLEPTEWFTTARTEFEKCRTEWHESQNGPPKPLPAGVATRPVEPTAEPPENVFSVADVTDIGNGVPLFKEFGFEDWALFALRTELYLLAHAYNKALNDPDRPGIHESNLMFYYGKFFKKQLSPKLYGKDTISDLLTLVKDTVSLDSQGVMVLAFPDERPVDIFLKMQEESRRERVRRLDSGDDTARLDFSGLRQLHQHQVRSTMPPPGKGDFKGGDFKGDKGGGKGKGWKSAPRQWNSKGGKGNKWSK